MCISCKGEILGEFKQNYEKFTNNRFSKVGFENKKAESLSQLSRGVLFIRNPQTKAYFGENSVDNTQTKAFLPKHAIVENNDNLYAKKSRFSVKPAHMLAIMLILITALSASLTMLFSQAVTYNKIIYAQNDSNNYKSKGFSKSNKFYEEKTEGKTEEKTEEKTEDSAKTERKKSIESENSAKNSSVENQSAKSSTESSLDESGRVNINSATLEELQTIKGIGPAMAKRIISQRNSVGKFRRIEDLLKIRGIGPKILKKIRSMAFVG